MSELPIPEQLGVRRFQDQSQVVRPSVDMSGMQRFAGTIQNISDRVDQSSLQKAKILFQRKKLEADNSFDKDQDFETYQQRYDEMIGKAADESAKLIRSPRLQEAFKQEISLYQAEGSERIKKKAFEKETERGIADLNESMTMARENYLRSTDPKDREFARESAVEAIDYAESKAYVDTAKAQELRKGIALDLAVASVKIETPENQIKLLKENKGLIDLIPMDTRLNMLKSAESQYETEKALVLSNEITSMGGDLDSRLKEADKIQDPKLKENVKQQIGVDYNREKAAKAEAQYSAYDTVKKNVIAGKSSLEASKENPELWNAMTADQQQSIRAMDSNRTKSSDLNVYNTLNQLAGKDRNQAYQYFTENAHKLSDSDIRKWSDRLAKQEELDGFIERKQMFDSVLSQNGIKDKKSSEYQKALEQMDADYLAYQRDFGKKPSPEETKRLINNIVDVVVEGTLTPQFLGGTNRWTDLRGFEVGAEQRRKMLNDQNAAARSEAANKKLDAFRQKLNQYEAYLQERSNGTPVVLSDKQINDLYNAWDRDGLLDVD